MFNHNYECKYKPNVSVYLTLCYNKICHLRMFLVVQERLLRVCCYTLKCTREQNMKQQFNRCKRLHPIRALAFEIHHFKAFLSNFGREEELREMLMEHDAVSPDASGTFLETSDRDVLNDCTVQIRWAWSNRSILDHVSRLHPHMP